MRFGGRRLLGNVTHDLARNSARFLLRAFRRRHADSDARRTFACGATVAGAGGTDRDGVVNSFTIGS